MTMTKTERGELRSLIRQRFKVLRADVNARRAELEDQVAQEVARQYAAADKAWQDAMFLIDEAGREANRKANDILRALPEAAPLYPDGQHRDHRIVGVAGVRRPDNGRAQLMQASMSRIEVNVRAVLLRLDREETELLTRLVEGALESDTAREFLRAIPTVSELVPADRLLALEQALRDGG